MLTTTVVVALVAAAVAVAAFERGYRAGRRDVHAEQLDLELARARAAHPTALDPSTVVVPLRRPPA